MPDVDNPAVRAFGASFETELVWAQVLISRGRDSFELRHTTDRDLPDARLKPLDVPALRTLAQFTASGNFRPLKSAPSLVSGWRCAATGLGALGRALDHLYPGSVADWFATQQAPPPITRFETFTARQTGMYRITQMLSPLLAGQAIRAACHNRFCLKRRLWPAEAAPPDPCSAKSLIPCLEPCALLLEFARKSMRIEQESMRIEKSPKCPLELGADEVQSLRYAIESAIDRPTTTPREGDFNAIENPRRLQLLLEKIRHLSLIAATALSLCAVVALSGCKREANTPAGTNAPPRGTPESPVVDLGRLDPTPKSPVDTAWEALQTALEAPPAPPGWKNQEPTEEMLKAFDKQKSDMAVQVADRAKDFYTRFPEDARSEDARRMEYSLLGSALHLGNTNHVSRMADIETAFLKDPKLPEDERLQLRVQQVQRSIMQDPSMDAPARLTSMDKAARGLRAEFPARTELVGLFVSVAQGWVELNEPSKARALVEELGREAALPESLKSAVAALAASLDRIGKPMKLEATALDGKPFNLESLRGRVVLIDFWATWAEPCLAELPKLKAAYEKHHDKGFEIVGINLDPEKSKLEGFLKSENIKWIQIFEGSESPLARGLGIETIPTQWLIDKSGAVRFLNARQDLEAKVAALLSEQ